jgi:uncharacterized membrane protein YkoI
MTAPTSAGEAEEKAELKGVPAVVTDAVKARFKEAELLAASKETEHDTLVYEVTVKDKGQSIDVTVTPQGEIVMIEKEITAKDLPAAVAKALEEKYAKASYKIVEEITTVEKKSEKLAYYEVLLVTADKDALEVQIASDGKIVNVEEKKASEADEK